MLLNAWQFLAFLSLQLQFGLLVSKRFSIYCALSPRLLNKWISSSTFFLFISSHFGQVSLDVRPLNDLSGPIQQHLTWSIRLPHPPVVSDIYWLTWQGLSIKSQHCHQIVYPSGRLVLVQGQCLTSAPMQADTPSCVAGSSNWFGLLRLVQVLLTQSGLFV